MDSTHASNKRPSKLKQGEMDVFRSVDERVSKPVLGSDGAARWQEFHQKSSSSGGGSVKQQQSVAPMAPMKAADRAAGMKSWQDERQMENETRNKQGLESLEDKQGYTHFKQKQGGADDGELSNKQRKRIMSRIRPEEDEYFISAKTFQGWKWDYVFTTRTESYGTGYFWDGTDSLLELQGKRQRPSSAATITNDRHGKRKQDVAHQVEKNKKGDPSAKKKEDSPASPTKKKKKKKAATTGGAGPTIVHDPNHPLEQVAAALQRHQQQDSTLPVGWYAAKDPFSGKTYYYHGQTGERSWEKPTGEAKQSSSPPLSQQEQQENNNKSASDEVDKKASQIALPPGWTAARDANSGKEYYFNTLTQQTQWERPKSEADTLQTQQQ